MACKRNAFLMLFSCDQGRAVDYLSHVIQQIPNFGENLQLVVIELIRKVCKNAPSEKVCFCVLFFFFSFLHFQKYIFLFSPNISPSTFAAFLSC